jgi:hypothetical protein
MIITDKYRIRKGVGRLFLSSTSVGTAHSAWEKN